MFILFTAIILIGYKATLEIDESVMLLSKLIIESVVFGHSNRTLKSEGPLRRDRGEKVHFPP